MLGVLLYFATLSFVPHIFAIVLLFWVLFRRTGAIQNVWWYNKTFISVYFFLCIGCTLNVLFHNFKGIPNIYMTIITYICAFALEKKDVRIFAILVFCECFIGFYEYSLGIESIVPGVSDVSFQDEELLYYKRVAGLSVGSSSFSQKILYSIIFLMGYKSLFTKRERYLMNSVFILGLFCTFNRTTIIIVFIFYILFFCEEYKRYLKRHWISIVILVLCFILISSYFLYGVFDKILYQMTRGNSANVLTGRDYIWLQFIAFIRDNLLFGNGSVRLLVPYWSGPIHAHNSYLQLIADNGVILAFIYLMNVFFKLNTRNRLLCFPMFLTSFTQFIIFWGFSVADVFLFAFLCNPKFYLAGNEK